MIRVLQVHSDLDWGGIEVWLMEVLRRLDPNAFQFDFVASKVHPEFREAVRSLGGTIFDAPPPSRFWKYLPRLRQILRQHGPYDVVHSHFVDHSGIVLEVAKRCGVAVRIAHSHLDLQPVFASVSRFRRFYFRQNCRLVQRNATWGLAASGKAAETLYGDSWKRDPRFEVLPCGIDLGAFKVHESAARVRAELGLPQDAFVIGHVGRFMPQKNHAFLLNIAAEVVRKEPRARFLLVGHGPIEPWFRDQLRAMGLDRAVLVLSQRPDVPRLMLHAMDAFLFPSLFEGLGLALVEAQAAGLPCIASDTIPEEADVVPSLVRRLPLSEPANRWADALCTHRPSISRSDALRKVEMSCFNAENSTRTMQQRYRELCRQPELAVQY